MLYRCMYCATVKGMVFKQFTLRDIVYKSESFGLESGIIFQDTDQPFKDFSLDKRDQQLQIKNNIMQICR